MLLKLLKCSLTFSTLDLRIIVLSMKHRCVLRLGCRCRSGCGTGQFLKKVGTGATGLGN